MKTCKRSLLLIASLCFGNSAFASHSLSADITYEYLGGLTFGITVTYYMDINTPADREQISLMYSDGTLDTFPRISQEFLPGDISKNIYTGTHTFVFLSPATVMISDPNFIDDIINVTASVNVPMVVETTIAIPEIADLGPNTSPVFYDVPVDYAEIGEVFTHDADFYDADGDELKFYFVDAALPDYVYPNEILPCDATTFMIDEATGLITWDHPCSPGIYIAKIKIEERRTGILLSTIYRYFVIKVDDTGATEVENELNTSQFIYPNPADHMFTVQLTSCTTLLNIYNAQGEIVKSIDCSDKQGSIQVDINDMPAGYYLLRLFNQEDSRSGNILVK